ncbi:ANTAR domain-containing response regulator [Yersinia similis]|uniref:Response regulator n=1 Tax=Yersinia similis TaxID=367190 RepID=A0A0T9QVZ5_9GAMM|nr:ANTAR domain-containing protein [Yersinia similis]CNG13966.1 Response regulator [Yersinia similis]CNI31570.1 Response regulator [Yersinia similis]
MPPPPEPPECQLLVLAATPQWVRTPQPWLRSPQPMPLIAIVTYESPTILDYLLEIEAAQVLATPFRTSGLLSSLMLVLQSQQIRQRLENKNKRLRAEYLAEAYLMQHGQMTEQQAHKTLQQMAMQRQQTLLQVAETVIRASEQLNRDDKA